MTALMKYLTIDESEVVAIAIERSDDRLIGRLVSIIERLQIEVDNRAWLRPQRDPDDPETFILASGKLYPPKEAAEYSDARITFDTPDGRLNHPPTGSRDLFSATITVPVSNMEIAAIHLEPRRENFPSEQDSFPLEEHDPSRQSVSIRASFEDGVPVVRASISSGSYLKQVSAGFTAEMHKEEIKLRLNGRTETIAAQAGVEEPD